ncbi:GalNAc(5)-diNAcBac-PP-undecaprenol beta-1,3-glucosyltransferase [compost metagenome]
MHFAVFLIGFICLSGCVMKLSVTIATYNRLHLLEKIFDSLFRQTLDKSNFEVIVCDSNSSDGTEDFLKKIMSSSDKLKVSHVHTVNNLAAKRNIGIKHAAGEVVIFFDDDCVPEIDCLETYFKLFQEDEPGKKTVYCGEVRFPAEWVSDSNYYRFRDSRHFGSGKRKDLNMLDYRTIVVMNMAFYKDSFLSTVKSVSEEFKGYGCEDQDLGWRLQESGFEIKRCNARIYHHELSGDIAGYEKKIFHTARDGMTTLLSRTPAAVIPLRAMKLLDKDYPFENKVTGYFYALLRFFAFHQSIARLLAWAVTKTDKRNFVYFPIVYRYVLGCAYIRGVNARRLKSEVGDDWYS